MQMDLEMPVIVPQDIYNHEDSRRFRVDGVPGDVSAYSTARWDGSIYYCMQHDSSVIDSIPLQEGDKVLIHGRVYELQITGGEYTDCCKFKRVSQ
ncbi:hypothetical protein JOD82_001826 [Paenibacillus sp. 1182]|uniref:hypothetical protein n=1 Tax=Paenibacillus sp. 1182 TaxID=2806565 RepID=UPI001AE68BD6|nr:hypothetical protein [Paenibacillus sp. 1182]MBP1308806.1 hypothetical protein [Paenibacillus sp. 1182]